MSEQQKTRADLKRQYKERKRQAGVFQIRNTRNGKVLLGSSADLHGPFNKHRFMLTYGSHKNERLQADWKAYGAEAFAFEILELVKESDDPNFCLEDELTLLEQIWIEKLQPFGDNGYNEGDKIRRD
jgi:group I intron endonuclease